MFLGSLKYYYFTRCIFLNTVSCIVHWMADTSYVWLQLKKKKISTCNCCTDQVTHTHLWCSLYQVQGCLPRDLPQYSIPSAPDMMQLTRRNVYQMTPLTCGHMTTRFAFNQCFTNTCSVKINILWPQASLLSSPCTHKLYACTHQYVLDLINCNFLQIVVLHFRVITTCHSSLHHKDISTMWHCDTPVMSFLMVYPLSHCAHEASTWYYMGTCWYY